ncbi:Rib/alpha-like domain-containing protein [Mycoplasma phocoenae]|uniref:Rib domain-containing protein n=1 Tax=Mycoplasma phocoenae TaxID=754517 RepID=A0A858U3K3_9MOLU|nr:Rib/alpha-like domain-containing protein [Mycoplasma phocoenae]QJG67050.1 hypothetical protein HGG69_01820 [Mycoplasma phocoenae]
MKNNKSKTLVKLLTLTSLTAALSANAVLISTLNEGENPILVKGDKTKTASEYVEAVKNNSIKPTISDPKDTEEFEYTISDAKTNEDGTVTATVVKTNKKDSKDSKKYEVIIAKNQFKEVLSVKGDKTKTSKEYAEAINNKSFTPQIQGMNDSENYDYVVTKSVANKDGSVDVTVTKTNKKDSKDVTDSIINIPSEEFKLELSIEGDKTKTASEYVEAIKNNLIKPTISGPKDTEEFEYTISDAKTNEDGTVAATVVKTNKKDSKDSKKYEVIIAKNQFKEVLSVKGDKTKTSKEYAEAINNKSFTPQIEGMNDSENYDYVVTKSVANNDGSVDVTVTKTNKKDSKDVTDSIINIPSEEFKIVQTKLNLSSEVVTVEQNSVVSEEQFKKVILNYDELPKDTTIEIINEPDTSNVGEQTAKVKVNIPVEIPQSLDIIVDVKEFKNEIRPSIDYSNEIEVNTEVTEDILKSFIKNVSEYPKSSVFKLKEPLDTTVIGQKTATLIIKQQFKEEKEYPLSITVVSAPVFKESTAKWTNSAYTKGYKEEGTKLTEAEIKNSISILKDPNNPYIEYKITEAIITEDGVKISYKHPYDSSQRFYTILDFKEATPEIIEGGYDVWLPEFTINNEFVEVNNDKELRQKLEKSIINNKYDSIEIKKMEKDIYTQEIKVELVGKKNNEQDTKIVYNKQLKRKIKLIGEIGHEIGPFEDSMTASYIYDSVINDDMLNKLIESKGKARIGDGYLINISVTDAESYALNDSSAQKNNFDKKIGGLKNLLEANEQYTKLKITKLVKKELNKITNSIILTATLEHPDIDNGKPWNEDIYFQINKLGGNYAFKLGNFRLKEGDKLSNYKFAELTKEKLNQMEFEYDILIGNNRNIFPNLNLEEGEIKNKFDFSIKNKELLNNGILITYLVSDKTDPSIKGEESVLISREFFKSSTKATLKAESIKNKMLDEIYGADFEITSEDPLIERSEIKANGFVKMPNNYGYVRSSNAIEITVINWYKDKELSPSYYEEKVVFELTDEIKKQFTDFDTVGKTITPDSPSIPSGGFTSANIEQNLSSLISKMQVELVNKITKNTEIIRLTTSEQNTVKLIQYDETQKILTVSFTLDGLQKKCQASFKLDY